MAKNVKLLVTVCLLAIAGVIILQFYWVKNYYHASLFNFEREVNLAFEDAVKKDFELRNDTIEQLLVEQLMDTSMFRVNSTKGRNDDGNMKFTVYETQNEKDSWTVSYDGLNDTLIPNDTVYKKKIVTRFAKHIRLNDLENHAVYFRTQHLGHFTLDKIKEYAFDTVRLRPVLKYYLNKIDIKTPFYFYTSKKDSTHHDVNIPDSLLQSGMLATKAFATYSYHEVQRYVRAVFENPTGYVFTKMKWILTSSLLLTTSVALCIWLLFKALFHEKKISAIKNDFINNITHELKTPVATISAAVEAVQNFDLNREQRTRYLDHAKNETKRLARLVDSILDISLYDKNKASLTKEAIDIKDIIQEIAENLRMASADKKISFQYVNNTKVDSISADKQLFQQALTNILENAIKYSGKEVDIDLSCQVHNGYFCLKCVDKGEGIAESAIPYIFERFYREPKPHHAVKGYGLGLSYVKEIMEAHQGKIEMSSNKGMGTTAILFWPI